jgi:signal transduction histidine kinase
MRPQPVAWPPVTTQIPVDRLKALTEAAATVVGTAQLENLLGRLVETARETTGARYVALGVIGEHKTLTEFVHRGIDEGTVAMIGHLPEGRGVLGTLIRDRTTIRLERLSDHPDSVGFPEHHPPMESFLGVAVGTADMAYGNLYLTEKDGGFTEEDEVLVGALAAIAGSAVETTRLRSRLERLAVIEDRQRIGRDLHDSIIQDLFATGLELQGWAARAGAEAVSEQLDHAVDRIDAIIDALRRVVSDLGRSGERSTFEEALRLHVGQLARPHDSAVVVTVEPMDIDFGVDLTDAILPIVGEAVSNALRHSDSAVVEVVVELLADRLLVSVIDQGNGFDPSTVERGMGLGNLEARAQRLGGKLSVRSVVGAGTVVEVVLPVA